MVGLALALAGVCMAVAGSVTSIAAVAGHSRHIHSDRQNSHRIPAGHIHSPGRTLVVHTVGSPHSPAAVASDRQIVVDLAETKQRLVESCLLLAENYLRLDGTPHLALVDCSN